MQVVTHNAASVDGRIDGFVPDIELYYRLTETWDVDAHLVGADTLIEGEQTTDPAVKEGNAENDPAGQRDDGDPPLLVVTDSNGRISGWTDILAQPYWGDVLVLCSERTPDDYLTTLADESISYIVEGEHQVDLEAALSELASRAVETVLVDSGGTLNGALLREGLVDEVSVLVHPVVVGGTSPRSFIRGSDPEEGPTGLELIGVEQPADGIVWLRYEVID